MSGFKILAIAIIGKENNPLWIRSYAARRGGEADLKFHYAAHASLDVFEEREAAATRTLESYLGLLFAMEDYVVYGFQTHTRIRFVLMLTLADVQVRDADIKTIFHAIHSSYISHLSNPFTVLDTTSPNPLSYPIRSRKFNRAMDAIAGAEGTNISPSSSGK